MIDDLSQEPEQIPGRAIAWVLGATILVIVCSAVVVWTLSAFHVLGGGESVVTTIPDTGTPPSRPFTLQTPPSRDSLEDWSWADRNARTVRVPIEVAIDRYLQERSQ